jgi:hypothetical protein
MSLLWWLLGSGGVVFGLWFGLLAWVSQRERWPR